MRPTRYKREYAVAQTVADMKRQFVYPDEDTQPANPVVGGGGGAPTVVVAAANASDISKNKADFLCQGVSDQQTIQAAVDATPNGGRIILTEGVFVTSGTITVTGIKQLTGIGSGLAASIVHSGNSPAITVGGGALLAYLDVRLDVGSPLASITTSGAARIFRCQIVTFDGSNGIRKTAAGPLLVSECFFDLDRGEDAVTANTNAGNFYTIVGNNFASCGRGVFLPGTANQTTIARNNIGGCASWGVEVEAGAMIQITDNIMNSNGVSANGAIAIGSNALQVAVTANQFDSTRNGPDIYCQASQVVIADNISDTPSSTSIILDGADRSTVRGNVIFDPEEHGIVLVGASDNVVAGNIVHAAGSDADNTYDNYQVDGNENLIHGNKSVPSPYGFFDTRYGFNIVAGNDNAVYANYLGDASAYGTADFIDNGTDTQTAPGANGQFGF